MVKRCLIPSLATTGASLSSESGRKDITKKNQLFDQEKKRQSNLIPRVEKIEVNVSAIPCSTSPITLLMNRGLSTPYHCSLHIHEHYSKMPFAEVDGWLWDMDRPLDGNCHLRFRHLEEENPQLPNEAFWRSCSFLLGMVIEKGLKEETGVTLHSWPKHGPKSGSFVYDVAIPSMDNWNPTRNELVALTNVFWKIKASDLMFQRLSVKNSLAKEIFSDNPYKLQQLESIALKRDDVTLYRVGDHIDFSVGPMMSSTGHLGRVTVTAVHKIGSLFRFQGVAIPSTLRMSHFVYNILIEKATRLNATPSTDNHCQIVNHLSRDSHIERSV